MPRIKFEDYKEAVEKWMMGHVLSNEDDCDGDMDMAEETAEEQHDDGVADDLRGALICEKRGICQGGFQ